MKTEKEPTLEQLEAYLQMVERWIGNYDDLKENLRSEIAKREAQSK